MNALSAQAEAAVLPAGEQQELERLRRAERLLEWLHALARRALDRCGRGADESG